jgi:Holliday junction DNA helicase RuvA
MIGSLRGTLLERSPEGEVLVEAGGVGYRVSVTPRTLGLVGDPGGEVFLYIHDHVREDAHTLYGFLARDERSCFEALLGAHGVGPALALAIMAVHAPLDLRRAVAADDADALCLVPGVGKKTAARLLIDLKTRLEVPDLDLTAVNGSIGGHASTSVVADVRDALTGLGYGPEEVREAMRDLEPGDDSAALLREALQRLASVRSHA